MKKSELFVLAGILLALIIGAVIAFKNPKISEPAEANGQNEAAAETPGAAETQTGTGTQTGTDTKKADASKARVIRFAVPEDLCRVSEENLRYFNEALLEDGLSYQLELVRLGNCVGSKEYSENLAAKMKSGEVDIAFLGLDDIDGGNSAYELIRSGAVLKLDEILSEGRGKVLYDAFPKNLWETVKCNKQIFSIPSAITVDDGGVYVAFNRNVLSDDVIEKWDGSIEGIYEMIKNVEWNDSEAPRFQYLVDRYGFANMIGCEFDYGLVFDHDTLTVQSPLESEKVMNYLKVLDQMKKDGYMTYTQAYTHQNDYDEAVYRREVLNRIENCKFVVALAEGRTEDSFGNSNIVVKRVKEYLPSRVRGSIGISSKAEKAEELVVFLSLLYTEGKYGNLLLYGREGVDYKVINGYACNLDGTELEPEIFDRMCLNLAINVYPGSAEKDTINRKDDLFAYYENAEVSPFLGFEPDTADLNGIADILNQFVIETGRIDTSLDETVAAAAKKLESKDIDKYVESVRSQWEEYRK